MSDGGTTTIPTVEDVLPVEKMVTLPAIRIEHSLSRTTQDRMLINLVILLGIVGGLKLLEMVIFKALNTES